MSHANFIVFYVSDAVASAALYGQLLGSQPIESSPGWAMFALGNGFMLGLWSKDEAEPKPKISGGGSELIFAAADKDELHSTLAAWKARGLPILQEPTQMDFGYTFVAEDPDGHRLRVSVSRQP